MSYVFVSLYRILSINHMTESVHCDDRRGVISKSGTSLSATQETHDYSSFLTLFTEYLEHRLEGIHAGKAHDDGSRTIKVVQAGYSYGSMIASRVTPSPYDTYDRACPLYDKKISQHSEARIKISNVVHGLLCPCETPVSQDCVPPEPFINSRRFTFETYYLLVSPLLPPISSLLAPFTLKSWWPLSREAPRHLHEHATLAIYGTKDVFTSTDKLRRWAGELQNKPRSRYTYVAVEGAGHFWREPEECRVMQQAIEHWLKTIVRKSSHRPKLLKDDSLQPQKINSGPSRQDSELKEHARSG